MKISGAPSAVDLDLCYPAKLFGLLLRATVLNFKFITGFKSSHFFLFEKGEKIERKEKLKLWLIVTRQMSRQIVRTMSRYIDRPVDR